MLKKILNNNLYPISLYARQIAGTLVLFIIARYLSVYDYGLFTSYKSIIGFCFMFANMEYANYILVSSQANVKEVKLKISLFLINAVVIGVFIAFFSMFFKLENHLLFALIIIRTFFDGVFFGLILPYFQATKNFNTIAKINIVYAICISLIAVFSYIFKLSLCEFLILNIILGLINFIQCSYFAKINYFLVFNHLKRFCKMIDKSIFGYMGSTISDYLYAQTSSLYVAAFLPKEQAALYFSANTIATIVGLLSASQTQKMLPDLIKSDVNSVKKILKRNLMIVGFILTLVLIFVIIFGKALLMLLYGQNYYVNAYPILVIYFVANIFIANGAIFGVYLTSINKQWLKTKLKIETTIITLLGLLALHKFGIYGAVTALLISAIYVSTRFTVYSINFIKKGVCNEK